MAASLRVYGLGFSVSIDKVEGLLWFADEYSNMMWQTRLNFLRPDGAQGVSP